MTGDVRHEEDVYTSRTWFGAVTDHEKVGSKATDDT